MKRRKGKKNYKGKSYSRKGKRMSNPVHKNKGEKILFRGGYVV